MTKSLALGAILGGLTAFIWSFISWDVLPWHERTLQSFQDEDAVGRVIMEHTASSGVYLYPAGPTEEGMTKEQKKAAEAASMEKMTKGPVVFATIRREGFKSYARGIVIQFLTQVLAAFLLTWLVLKTGGSSYGGRVVFLTVVGLAAGVIVELPNWNWWGFSNNYTAVAITDCALTWLIAGLVIAKVAKPQTA
jgi:hypothetical protein